jgi:hypothetical protein
MLHAEHHQGMATARNVTATKQTKYSYKKAVPRLCFQQADLRRMPAIGMVMPNLRFALQAGTKQQLLLTMSAVEDSLRRI